MIKKLLILILLFSGNLFSQELSEMEIRKMTEDLQDGVHVDYHDNGNLKIKMTIKNGQLHGPFISYDKDKRIETSLNYLYGKEHGLSLFYYKGTEQISGSQMYKYGEPHGNYTLYSEDGEITYQESYKDGKLHGPYVSYYDNGEIFTQGSYKNGKQDGKWISGLYSGDIESIKSYKDGKLHGPFKISPMTKEQGNPQLGIETTYKYGEIDGTYKLYLGNGIILHEGSYINGKEDGVHKMYDLNGNGELVKEIIYKYGVEIDSKEY